MVSPKNGYGVPLAVAFLNGVANVLGSICSFKEETRYSKDA